MIVAYNAREMVKADRFPTDWFEMWSGDVGTLDARPFSELFI